jgi:hypothetical protein
MEVIAASTSAITAIVPLDDVLRSAFARREGGGNFGVRVGRRLTGRMGVELSVDRSSTPYKVTGGTRAGIEATRASFVPAFTTMIIGSSITGVSATSVSTVTDGSRSQTSLTGAVTIDLLPAPARGRRRIVQPFAVAGIGTVTNGNQTAGATLAGNYRFAYVTIPFEESLSGPAVTGLKTFTGSGTFVQLSVTAGYLFRF